MALCSCTKQPSLLWCCKSRIRLSPRGKLALQTYKITTSQTHSHTSSKNFVVDLVMLEEALVPSRSSCSVEVVGLWRLVEVGPHSFTAGETPLGVSGQQRVQPSCAVQWHHCCLQGILFSLLRPSLKTATAFPRLMFTVNDTFCGLYFCALSLICKLCSKRTGDVKAIFLITDLDVQVMSSTL